MDAREIFGHAHFLWKTTPTFIHHADNAITDQTQRLRACCYTVSKYVEELHSSEMAPRTARARSVHIGHGSVKFRTRSAYNITSDSERYELL